MIYLGPQEGWNDPPAVRGMSRKKVGMLWFLIKVFFFNTLGPDCWHKRSFFVFNHTTVDQKRLTIAQQLRNRMWWYEETSAPRRHTNRPDQYLDLYPCARYRDALNSCVSTVVPSVLLSDNSVICRKIQIINPPSGGLTVIDEPLAVDDRWCSKSGLGERGHGLEVWSADLTSLSAFCFTSCVFSDPR